MKRLELRQGRPFLGDTAIGVGDRLRVETKSDGQRVSGHVTQTSAGWFLRTVVPEADGGKLEIVVPLKDGLRAELAMRFHTRAA